MTPTDPKGRKALPHEFENVANTYSAITVELNRAMAAQLMWEHRVLPRFENTAP